MNSLAGELARVVFEETAGSPFACAVCRDTGMVVRTDGRGRPCAARQCECLARAAAARRMRAAGIPAKYAGASFSGILTSGVDPSVGHALRVCRGMAEEFLTGAADPASGMRRGLLLTGMCGIGKTHLAVAMLREVMQRYGVRGRFWQVSDLLTQLKRSFDREQRGEVESEAEVLEAFASVPVLVVDDLGAERLTEWSYAQMQLLVQARYAGEGASGETGPRLTVFTSNLPNLGAGEGARGVTTLGDWMGTRSWSRLQELCRHIDMVGTDFRRRR